MSVVFIDAGYFLALEFARDQHHAEALRHWQMVKNSGQRFVTSSFVFDEVVTLLSSRGRRDRAIAFGNSLRASKLLDIVDVYDSLLHEAWEYFCRHHDKSYSLTDCASFVIMQNRQLSTAFTFDHHFRQAGFTCEP